MTKLRSPAEIRRDAEQRTAQDPLSRELTVMTDRIRSAQIIARALVAARRTEMSITGADSFAGTLRERLAGAKAKIAGLHERMNGVVARGEAASEQAEQVVAAAEAEVAQLEGELRQLSNFPPTTGVDQK